MQIRKSWQMKPFILREIFAKRQGAGRIKLQHLSVALTGLILMRMDMKCCL